MGSERYYLSRTMQFLKDYVNSKKKKKKKKKQYQTQSRKEFTYP